MGLSMTSPPRHARMLLALDGQTLNRALLDNVLRACVPHSPRLDILLLNPPREPTSLLSMLLLRLEHSGVDYRVTSTHGDSSEEIVRYLGRHCGIDSVAVVDAARLSAEVRALIELRGHRLLSITSAD